MVSALTAICLIFAGTSLVFAQTSDLKATAKQYVADGLKAQSAGRYDEAISLYNKAYELVPHPELLFNLGQAHRMKGETAIALDYYKKYLAVDSKGRGVDEATQWVLRLDLELRKTANASLESEKMRETEEKEIAEPQMRAAEVLLEKEVKAETDREKKAAPAVKPAFESAFYSSPNSSGARKTLALSLSIGGGASMLAALIFYAHGQSVHDDYAYGQLHGESESQTDKLYDRANRSHLAAQAFALSGFALGVVGGYLWYTHRTSRKKQLAAYMSHISPIYDGASTGVVFIRGF